MRNRKFRIIYLIIILFATAIMFSTTTYAWFTSNRVVTINTINVHVVASGGIEISADGTNWTSVNGTTITGLKAGTYKVRVKATEGAPCGNAADVTVESNYKALDDSLVISSK